MLRTLAWILLAPVAVSAAGDREGPTTRLAAEAWAITDAVLARSIDPPSRQQMLLAGLKAMRREAESTEAPALAREVSGVTTAEEFGPILARSWPGQVSSKTPKQLEDALIGGMLAAVPGDAELISAKDLRIAEQVEGNLYVGVQVALGYDEEEKLGKIMTVLEGGPAEKAGAREGDLIEAVDGVELAGLPLKEVVDRLRGPLGSELTVRLRREKVAGPLVRTMTRAVLPRKTVEGFRKRPGGGWDVRLDGPAPIGYVKLKEIVGSTPAELRAFADPLESEGVRALVLDLREVTNGGLHPAILLADALLDGGLVGRIRRADGVETVRAGPDALFAGWPIAVVVGGRMSAEARWLAAALEDNRRAAVVGVPGGDGDDVRSAVPLPGDDRSVVMATGRLERADGRPLPSSPNVHRGDIRRAAMTPDASGLLDYVKMTPGDGASPSIPGQPAPAGSLAPESRAIPRPDAPRPPDPVGAAWEILVRKLKESGP